MREKFISQYVKKDGEKRVAFEMEKIVEWNCERNDIFYLNLIFKTI